MMQVLRGLDVLEMMPRIKHSGFKQLVRGTLFQDPDKRIQIVWHYSEGKSKC